MSNSNKPKVLFLDKAHPFLEAHLTERGFDCHTDTTSPKVEVETFVGQFQGIVMRSRFAIDKGFLEKATNLVFLAREGVGVEHIDVDFAESKGIKVLISPEGSKDTVAEHALGLLLCLMNNLSRADRQVRNGQWVREANRAVELKGKTVGILGYGNMGSAFALRLTGFGVRVLAYDKFKTGYGDSFAEEVGLETMFQEADVLSVHIPYSIDNHHFINDAFLKSFRKNIYLVNTARGLVLNTADLVTNLKSGKVAGAALDVLEYEETSFDKFRLEQLPPAFDYLCQAVNVVLSPHIAGWSFESKEKHARVLAEKIMKLGY
ncbi:MAG: hydroxyacid dehydrogenase [Saprospiraceae bacterium]|nr:hydroxyacid dehydrogenase [Saprospiraceae bacterium]